MRQIPIRLTVFNYFPTELSSYKRLYYFQQLLQLSLHLGKFINGVLEFALTFSDLVSHIEFQLQATSNIKEPYTVSQMSLVDGVVGRTT